MPDTDRPERPPVWVRGGPPYYYYSQNTRTPSTSEEVRRASTTSTTSSSDLASPGTTHFTSAFSQPTPNPTPNLTPTATSAMFSLPEAQAHSQIHTQSHHPFSGSESTPQRATTGSPPRPGYDRGRSGSFAGLMGQKRATGLSDEAMAMRRQSWREQSNPQNTGVFARWWDSFTKGS